MKRLLLRTAAFTRDLNSWLKIHSSSNERIVAVLDALASDPRTPSLRTHKLKGKYAGCQACSAGYDLRIVFQVTELQGDEAIVLLALGTHGDVY